MAAEAGLRDLSLAIVTKLRLVLPTCLMIVFAAVYAIAKRKKRKAVGMPCFLNAMYASNSLTYNQCLGGSSLATSKVGGRNKCRH